MMDRSSTEVHRRGVSTHGQGQPDAAVAFMGIASVNIYAGTIIVYIIAGMPSMDKGASNLDSRSFELRVLKLETS